MFKLDVISKSEYNKKLSSIEKHSDLIYNCFAEGGHNMKKIEAQLGIVSESLREVTFMGDQSKKGAVNTEQSKEARNLIKKLQIEKKAREDQRRQNEKMKTLQMEQESINAQKKMQEEKKLREELKLKQKKDIEEKIRIRREEQQKLKELQELELSKVKKIKPKHVEMAATDYLMDTMTLEDRKAKLQEIRSMKKPLNRDEFVQHEQSYLQRKQDAEFIIH